MEVNCEGCAGCCLDWRPLVDDPPDHERRGPWKPLDDVYNLVPLTRDDVDGFLEAGLADALTPRLWSAPGDGVAIDGHDLAAIGKQPVFFLGLRKPPKPVAPFGGEPAWLPTCAFLDPETLQCRIHDAAVYPTECGVYPGHNLELDAETECERVEDAVGGDRLIEDTPPEDLPDPLFGPQAIGYTVFVHPDPARLEGVVERVVGDGDARGARPDEITAADRAEFVAAALAGSPGTTATNMDAFDDAYERAVAAESWVSGAIRAWTDLEGDRPDPGLGQQVEEARGAPGTPGWE
ncbi:MAG: YkgJ family cysteine cluster protein [Halobacteriales archaeon]